MLRIRQENPQDRFQRELHLNFHAITWNVVVATFACMAALVVDDRSVKKAAGLAVAACSIRIVKCWMNVDRAMTAYKRAVER